MTSNSPAPADEGRHVLRDLPENKDLADKLVIGIFDKSAGILVGVLELIKHYPIQGVLMLGLLLLHPKDHQAGLGRQACAALENWWQSQNGHTLRLGVLEQNQSALIFWQKLGFQLIEKNFHTKSAIWIVCC